MVDSSLKQSLVRPLWVRTITCGWLPVETNQLPACENSCQWSLRLTMFGYWDQPVTCMWEQLPVVDWSLRLTMFGHWDWACLVIETNQVPACENSCQWLTGHWDWSCSVMRLTSYLHVRTVAIGWLVTETDHVWSLRLTSYLHVRTVANGWLVIETDHVWLLRLTSYLHVRTVASGWLVTETNYNWSLRLTMFGHWDWPVTCMWEHLSEVDCLLRQWPVS